MYSVLKLSIVISVREIFAESTLSGMWDLESHPELRYLSMTEVTRVVLNAGLYSRAPQRRETPGASEARGVVG